MNLRSFQHNDWTKTWEGRWSLLSCSEFGYQYTEQIRFGGRPFQSQAIIFASKGRSNGWMRQTDRDTLGNYLSAQVKRNPKLVVNISTELKREAQSFLQYLAGHENTVCTKKLYDDFLQRLLKYYKVHINVKYVVDYLEPKALKKYLPKLESARLVAEPVLNRTEDFIDSFAKLLAKQTGYNYKLLLCLTKDEIQRYFSSNKLPHPAELKKRYSQTTLLYEKKESLILTRPAGKKIESIVHPRIQSSKINGSTAFTGKVRGVARIVNNPKQVKIFNQGDILVSGSTRPEFLPLMHKAAAFVTDAGGILSHAAIVARELKKPCVIGTLIATKVFKNGDLIEVDATNGIVKKLN